MATPSYQVPPPPPPMYGPAVGGVRKEEGKWGLVAGILLMLSGIVAIGVGIYYAFVGAVIGAFFGAGPLMAIICGGIPLICGIFGLLGGIFAIKRTHWAIALIGSILCIWSILGILALIFLIVGKDEFH